jgi:hypothetical protein
VETWESSVEIAYGAATRMRGDKASDLDALRTAAVARRRRIRYIGAVTDTNYVIDDLGAPRLPRAIRLANRVLDLAVRHFPLAVDALLATAARRSGLSDYGRDDFTGALRVLIAAVRSEGDLTPVGHFLTRSLLLGLLVTRLRHRELLRRHPEIATEPVRVPIVILGLPRTGTTHLHNLLSQHPALRTLPYWESLEPIPDPRNLPVPFPDPRRARCAQALRFQNWVMPCFAAMHEMTPDAKHEEIQLLAVDFSTMLFEASYFLPSYRDWYVATDQTAAYRTLRELLQGLQWLRGPQRWLLKSPQHLEQLGPLRTVFPDARLVQTHRDPVRVVASMCTMATYGLRMQRARVDPHAVGRYWAERIEAMLRASVRDRALMPADVITDVRFHEFMADQWGTVTRVAAFAGVALTDDARQAMRRYEAEHQRGTHGTVAYRLADFGLDVDDLRARLRFYQDAFDVPDE